MRRAPREAGHRSLTKAGIIIDVYQPPMKNTAPVPTLIAYFQSDYPHTLFPLTTSRVLIENFSDRLLKYIYENILKEAEPQHSFLAQTRCYASKQSFHLRRTVKLDPIAELYLYELVYRNRSLFKRDFQDHRRSFGYRFDSGMPLSPTKSYAAFKSAVAEAKRQYQYTVKFDVAAYFNSIYHHDLRDWIAAVGASPEDVSSFGQFLRETNSGRSVDCLPHGIHPCKVIGAEFLKFVDNSARLQSELLLRFMDDFYLFSNAENILHANFVTVQRLLGEKGLSLNPSKTIEGKEFGEDIPTQIDAIKIDLLRARRQIFATLDYFDEEIDESEEQEESPLTPEQTEYLLNLLKNPEIEESDAELVLVLLRDHGEDVVGRMNSFLERFPSLTRNVYNFARFSQALDSSLWSSLMLKFMKEAKTVTEDQLFWIAKLSEDFLSSTKEYGTLLQILFDHPNATMISKAKILEIPEHRFGLPERRREHLRAGQSDWLSWAAAIGMRREDKASRNYVLAYFAKASNMNFIIADCLKDLN